MTREEQLACLKDRPCSVCKFHTDRCNRWTCVFEDEPEEQEPCEDVISRDAVLKQINCWIGSGEYRYAMSERFLIDRIKTLPPVTPKPKTDVLDKIRAEIEQEYNRLSATRADETLEVGECLGLKMALKIVGKYKAESEDKE